MQITTALWALMAFSILASGFYALLILQHGLLCPPSEPLLHGREPQKLKAEVFSSNALRQGTRASSKIDLTKPLGEPTILIGPLASAPMNKLPTETCEDVISCHYVGPLWMDIQGLGDLGNIYTGSPSDCAALCDGKPNCLAWEWSPKLAIDKLCMQGICSCHLLSRKGPLTSRFMDFKLYLKRTTSSVVADIVPNGWKQRRSESAVGVPLEKWVEGELSRIPMILQDPLDFVLQVPGLVLREGVFLEFGVFQAGTANQIAHYNLDGKMFGFDSFIGLPEDWLIQKLDAGQNATGKTRVIVKETFSLGGQLPPVRSNVELIKGWFNETLPIFLKRPEMTRKGAFIGLLHIDCDLYSSTMFVFNTLAPWIRPGTVIVFDELINFGEYMYHEIKALHEFLAARPQFRVEWLGCPCGVDTILGLPLGGMEGDGTCLATAIRIVSA